MTSDSHVSWLARTHVHGITGRISPAASGQSIGWICHLGSNSHELFLRRAFVSGLHPGFIEGKVAVDKCGLKVDPRPLILRLLREPVRKKEISCFYIAIYCAC